MEDLDKEIKQEENTKNDKVIHVNHLSNNQKSNFISRIIVAIVIVLFTLPCMCLGGWFWFGYVFLLLMLLTHELLKAPQKQNRKFKWLIYLFSYFMMITLTYWMFFKTNAMDVADYFDMYKTLDGFNFSLESNFPKPSLSISCFACNIGFFFLLVLVDREFTINDAFYFVTMFFVCSLAMQCFLFLRYIPFSISAYDTSTNTFKYLESAILIGSVFVSALMNDVGAYIVGIFFGKHKMTFVSPKKTWEGFFGGIVISLISAFIYSLILNAFGFSILKGIIDFEHWYNLLLIALVNPLIGTLGDLLFSSIKRNFNIKDFGTILRSHGGILDRIDSLIFVSISTSILVLIMMNKWDFFI